MGIVLRVIDGPQAGSSCEVREGERIIVGRGEESQFHVLDSWASRRHCAIEVRPDGIFIEDLQTKNGTYVGGRPVTKARIPDASLIQIGTTTVQVLAQADRGTVVAGASPARRRLLRVAAYAGAALLLLGGAAYGVLLVAGALTADGGKGTSWMGGTKGGGGFRLFGGPSTVAVEVTSEPSGATVFVDDVFHGTTPVPKLEATRGQHVLRVQKAGYEVHRATVDFAQLPQGPLHIALKLAERGTLVVHSKPDGASVYLDGDYRGNTPLQLKDLDPQTYSLRLSKTNFADWHQDVAVKPTETVTIEGVLGRREVDYYEAELKKDPDNVSCHTEVAHLYLLDQKVEPCMQHLSQALEITVAGRDTTRPEPYTARLEWLLAKIYFNDHFAYGDEAFVRKMQGHIDYLLAELAGRHPDSSAIVSAAQRLYKRAGTTLVERAAAYEARAKAEPAELSHALTAAGFFILGGESARAEAVLHAACQANTADHRPYVALGRYFLGAKKRGAQGAQQKAIEAFNAALQNCKSEELKPEIRKLLGQATQ